MAYDPQIQSATDMYSFGMSMPERTEPNTGSEYRFGFNGKENDSESGTQDYGMRIYNPGLGRFLSVDPLYKSFAFYSPYQFAGNTPIMAIDLDGAEIEQTIIKNADGTVTVLRVINIKWVNLSNLTDDQAKQKAEEYRCQTEDSYSGTHTDPQTGVTYVYVCQVNLTQVASKKEIDYDKEMSLFLVNRVRGERKTVLGKTTNGDGWPRFPGECNPVNAHIQIRSDLSSEATKKMGPHETGHAMGLEDGSKKGNNKYPPLTDNVNKIKLAENNAMIIGKNTTGTKINFEQQQMISKKLEEENHSKTIDNTEPPK